MTPPSADRRREAAAEWGPAVFVVAAVAIASTWPLATSPSLVPHHQDPLFSSWRLTQWAHNLAAGGAGGLFSGNIFHPAPYVLLYSDAILLPALIAAPFVLAGVPVTLVYTALFWLATLTAGLAMYACARRLSGSRPGALVAAAIFTGAPSRIEHVMHFELLWAAFLPLAVLATIRAFDGERRAPWHIAAAIAGQVLSCIYYGVFLLTLWPVLALVEWVRRRGRVPPGLAWRLGAALAGATLVAGLYSWPYQYARAVVGDRSEADLTEYSASLASYVAVPPVNRVWGWRAAPSELRLSPGVTALVLAAVGLTAPGTPWVAAIAITTAVAIDASRGPKGWVYPVLRALVPPYRGLRVPARFGGLVLLGVALLASVGLARRIRAAADARVVTFVALALVVGEGASTLPVRALPRSAPPVYAWLATLPPTVIAHAPLPKPDALPGFDADFQYFAQYHPHRLVNGNSGFYPPTYLTMLERARSFPDEQSLVELRRLGVAYLLVHEQFYAAPDAFGRVLEALEQRRDMEPVATSRDDGGVVRVYRLR